MRSEEVSACAVVVPPPVQISKNTSRRVSKARRAADPTQVTLPMRFLVTTAHLIAVVTVLFDLVRGPPRAWVM